MGRKAATTGAEATIECRKCRAACPPSFKFCDQCGQKLHVKKSTKRTKPHLAQHKLDLQTTLNAPESSNGTQAWFWGSQALPSVKVPAKPIHEHELNENQQEDINNPPPRARNHRKSYKRPREATLLPLLQSSAPSVDAWSAPKVTLSTAPQVSLIWGQTFEKASAELEAKEAMLAAEIAANAQILAHMEAQAQAHAFQNDDVFKFACKSKRDLERALALDKAALSRVRGQLVQLGLNETAVNHTKLHIQRLEGIEELARARRLAAASRVQAWYRRQRQRQMTRGRLRMKICRGYLRYRYVKRAHDVFPGQFFYFYDRKVKDSHACLEFVGDFSRGVYSQPFPVHFSPHPVHHLSACATCIQRWYRGIKAKWRRVLEAIQRMVLDKARAVALQRNAAATKLQGLFRSRQAKRRLQLLVSSTFEECVDPATNMTFYYNAKTQVSQWTRPKLWKPAAAANTTKPRRPKLNLNDMDTPRRVQLCAVKIQGLFRTNLATKKLKLLVAQTYQKVLDPDTNQWYYYNAKTNASQWAKPALLGTGDMIHHASSSTLKEPQRLATKTSPYDGLLPTARRKDVAAVKIQGLFRTRNARRHLRHLIAQTYRKVFDADANMCYYYNAKTGESHWTKPTLLGAADIPEPIASVSNVTTALPSTALNTLPTPRRIEVAATKIQGLFRTRNARRRLRHLIAQTYQKVLDVDSQQFYYFNTKTGESQWGKPILLGTGDMEELVPPPQNTPRPRVSQQRSPKLTTLSTPRRVEVAATKIQGLYRTRNARCRLRHLIAQTYQRVLDTDSQQFYYYNTKTGESQWVKPVLLGTSDLVDETQVRHPTNPRKRGGDPRAFLVGLNPVQQRQAAATKLQGLFRARLARRRLVGLIASTYHKFVDEESQASYYYNVKTGESSWVKPALLRSDTLPRQ